MKKTNNMIKKILTRYKKWNDLSLKAKRSEIWSYYSELMNVNVTPKQRREYLQKANKASVRSRFGNMTKKQRSAYMRCVSYGGTWDKTKQKCNYPLGVDFGSNIKK